jgi:hypothetical protein
MLLDGSSPIRFSEYVTFSDGKNRSRRLDVDSGQRPEQLVLSAAEWIAPLVVFVLFAPLKPVIPNGAGRFFFPSRSCETVGLRM